MADTEGIEADAKHKKSIAAQIKNHLGYVHAVLILANGSNARISVSMDYALSVLPSLFPKNLVNNIAFLFSNVPTAASLNFPHDAIPKVLNDVPKFLIDNPIALQKNYLKQKGHMDMKTENKIKKSVKDAEQNALEMLVELFDWLDGLEPQPTTELIAIHDKAEAIESKITSTLDQMGEAATKMVELKGLTEKLRNGTAVSFHLPSLRNPNLMLIGRRA